MSVEEIGQEPEEIVEDLNIDPEPQDTPEPEGEVREMTIPDDPDEFDAFYDELDEEDRKSLDAYLRGDDEVDPEAAQPTEDNPEDSVDGEGPEGQPELTHDISQQEYDELPESSKAYVDSMKTRLDALAQYEDDDYISGLEAVMKDPIVSDRIRQLQGQEGPADLDQKFLSNEAIKALKIDFDFDSRGSTKRLQQHINSAVMNAVSQVHDSYKQQNAQKEYNTKLENEFRSIQELDSSLNSELPYNSPDHPMAGFTKWLMENTNNINVVSMGGVDTYKLYLSKTGQQVHETATEVRKAVVRNVAKAKSKHARTLPRSTKSQGASDKKIVHGIDVERFKTDEAYMDSIYAKHGDNPKMLKTLNSWSFN